MIKRMAAAVALSVMFAGIAVAQSPSPAPAEAPAAAPQAAPAAAATASPASLDDCINAASSLGQLAEGKTLPDDKLDKLDELFTKMESLCDAKNFTEAANVAKDIKTMLDGQ